jgi:hypothetical protein
MMLDVSVVPIHTGRQGERKNGSFTYHPELKKAFGAPCVQDDSSLQNTKYVEEIV